MTFEYGDDGILTVQISDPYGGQKKRFAIQQSGQDQMNASQIMQMKRINEDLLKRGFVSEEEKFALIAACDLLVLPSPYESLSVIVLEAWAMGRPVLVNSACKVLEGQCVRSGGGLFYRGYSEFTAALRLLAGDARLRSALGAAGKAYVSREYDWDVVEDRTSGFLASIAPVTEEAR